MPRSCPDCGASLEDEIVVKERLSDLGYAHRDRTVECPECPRRVTFGIPRERSTALPPACDVCGGRTYPYKLDFHRWRKALYEPTDDLGGITRQQVEDLVPLIDVHWKCEDCFYFQSGDLEHYTADVYGLGVEHLVGRQGDA